MISSTLSGIDISFFIYLYVHQNKNIPLNYLQLQIQFQHLVPFISKRDADVSAYTGKCHRISATIIAAKSIYERRLCII